MALNVGNNELKMRDLNTTLEKYFGLFVEDTFHRYKSWEHCFTAFASETEEDHLALHLGFYLASWGMYRGSSGLLQKNYKIHIEAVSIIKSERYMPLQCNSSNEMISERICLLFELKNKLSKHYAEIKFSRGNNTNLKISPTDTLISKILLGTLGCVPAYDRYFNMGLNQKKIQNKTLSESSIENLLAVIKANKAALIEVQQSILAKTGVYYPFMKIMDMYFWQIGYDFELMKEKEKEKIKI